MGFQARLDALIDRERKRLSTKLTIRRLIHELPEDAAELTPMLEVLCSLIGLDLPGLRAAAADLPDGLFIVMGPPTNAGELLGALLREPFIHFLELVHGRRARTWSAGESRRDLVEGLLDPEIRVVCTLGHGLWDEISMNGFAAVPEAAYARIRVKLREDPKKYAPLLQQGMLYPFGLTYSGQPLRETDLSELVHAWFPTEAGRHASAKDLVVRYTCGSGRWRVGPHLARALVPESLEEVLDVSSWGLAPARPGADPSTWQEPLEAWLEGHAVELAARTAFGTSLVRDPSDTRGYDGLVWLPDFVENPIPAPTLPWSPTTTTPEHVPEPVPCQGC